MGCFRSCSALLDGTLGVGRKACGDRRLGSLSRPRVPSPRRPCPRRPQTLGDCQSGDTGKNRGAHILDREGRQSRRRRRGRVEFEYEGGCVRLTRRGMNPKCRHSWVVGIRRSRLGDVHGGDPLLRQLHTQGLRECTDIDGSCTARVRHNDHPRRHRRTTGSGGLGMRRNRRPERESHGQPRRSPRCGRQCSDAHRSTSSARAPRGSGFRYSLAARRAPAGSWARARASTRRA